MKHRIAVAVGVGVALTAMIPSAVNAQSGRVDASVRSPNAEFRITIGSGHPTAYRDGPWIREDCARCDPAYAYDQGRYHDEAWSELSEHERERLKDLREAEREYLKDAREAERDYRKDLHESRRERLKDQREREREYLERQRELERDDR